MVLQDVAVLLLGPDPPRDFIDKLKTAGFGAIYEIGAVADARDGLNRVSGEGRRGVVTVDARDGYSEIGRAHV